VVTNVQTYLNRHSPSVVAGAAKVNVELAKVNVELAKMNVELVMVSVELAMVNGFLASLSLSWLLRVEQIEPETFEKPGC
jgi:hypothetical protein